LAGAARRKNTGNVKTEDCSQKKEAIPPPFWLPRWRGFAIRAKEQTSFAPKIFCKQFAVSEMVAQVVSELIIFGS